MFGLRDNKIGLKGNGTGFEENNIRLDRNNACSIVCVVGRSCGCSCSGGNVDFLRHCAAERCGSEVVELFRRKMGIPSRSLGSCMLDTFE